MRIAIIYSIPTKRARSTLYALTDEDTIQSAKAISLALGKLHHSSYLVPISEHTIDRIRQIRADLIFNLIEWTGLDLPLAIRAMDALASLGIPYTGVSKQQYVNTTDKSIMKHFFHEFGLPTPSWQVFYSDKEPIRKIFHYPVILKPTAEHASIGVTSDSVARNPHDMHEKLSSMYQQFHQPILVEEFIRGDEYHVPILESAESVSILPPTKIVFDPKTKYPLLSFFGRWAPGHTDFSGTHISSHDLNHELLQRISHLCIKTFSLFSLRDYARVDLRVRKSEVYLLEINSNPGLDDDPEYEFMRSCVAAHMSFPKLIRSIVTSAKGRIGEPLGS